MGDRCIKEKMVKDAYLFSELQMNKKVRVAHGTLLCVAFFFFIPVNQPCLVVTALIFTFCHFKHLFAKQTAFH